MAKRDHILQDGDVKELHFGNNAQSVILVYRITKP